MNKLLTGLLLSPLICNANILKLTIEKCNTDIVNETTTPMGLRKNDVSSISNSKFRLSTKVIDKTENSYTLEVDLFYSPKKYYEYEIISKILLLENEKTILGESCSDLDNSGHRYFLTYMGKQTYEQINIRVSNDADSLY